MLRANRHRTQSWAIQLYGGETWVFAEGFKHAVQIKIPSDSDWRVIVGVTFRRSQNRKLNGRYLVIHRSIARVIQHDIQIGFFLDPPCSRKRTRAVTRKIRIVETVFVNSQRAADRRKPAPGASVVIEKPKQFGKVVEVVFVPIFVIYNQPLVTIEVGG